MHMTKNLDGAQNQYSFWSACVMLVTTFAIADALTGGLLREAIVRGPVEYATVVALVIVAVGVYASDGSPGARFVRAYSRHKL
jgi:hypothetical protein